LDIREADRHRGDVEGERRPADREGVLGDGVVLAGDRAEV
jgi:hypothetical protein